MAWVATDGAGVEWIFTVKPHRLKNYQSWEIAYKDTYVRTDTIELPKGSIKKFIGKDMTWEDEPINLYDLCLDQ